MATERDDDLDEKLFFNGIDATTGSYLFDRLTSSELADIAQGKTIEKKEAEPDHLDELKFRNSLPTDFVLKEGDPGKLEEAGWGVIFAAVKAGSDEEKEQAAIYEALQPLLALRRR